MPEGVTLSERRAQLQEARERRTAAKMTREILHESAYARLLARLESQPVIEQAKGILMAESRCSAEDAFEMLRRASQRQNVRVRDLAAQIVARASNNAQRRQAAQNQMQAGQVQTGQTQPGQMKAGQMQPGRSVRS